MRTPVLITLFLTFAGCFTTDRCAPRPPGAAVEGTLVRVVDGDTVVVQTAGAEENVRFKGIDCPEASPNSKCRADGDCDEDIPLGKAATARLETLLQEGDRVMLVSATPEFERDRYGRLLAYVEEDGVDLGLVLVREGHCSDFSHRYPHPRSETYLSASP